MFPLIATAVALEIMLLPVWAGLVMAAREAPLRRRLTILLVPLVVLAAVFSSLAMAADVEGFAAGVLRAHAVVLGFAILLAGLAAILGRIAGARTAQILTALLGWVLVAGIILAGPAMDLTRGDVQQTIVRVVGHADPLVVAEGELGLDWSHSTLTYRLSPLGDSYSYLLRDMAWWKTLLGYVFVGTGLVVFSVKRRKISPR